MAHYQLTQTQHSSLLARFSSLWDVLRTDLAKWRLYRATVAELNLLGDRELNDLDIPRGDIQRIARETAYGIKA